VTSTGDVRIAVIGGGIVGAFAAWFAARAGARVTVIERDHVGDHASGNNPGGLNPLYGPGIPVPLATLALESFQLHQRCAEEGAFVVTPQTKRRLNLAADDGADADALRQLELTYNSTPGFSATRLSRRELLECEPRLTPSVTHGVLAEGDMHVEARGYTVAVASAVEGKGSTTRHTLATGLETEGRRVVAVRTASGRVPCDAVVVATGPWSTGPAAWLGVTLPIVPVKGELLLAEVPGGSVALDIVCRSVAVYRVDGARALIGGTEESVGFDEGCTATARDALLEGAARILPSLARAKAIGHSAGLRPVTPDGIPIIGLAAGWENACLALGGGRKGMLFGPAMGKAAVDLLLEGSTDLPIDPCSPERFAPVQAG
jgi:glycine oxidase